MITSFNLEDAIQLQYALQQYQALYRDEWETVVQRWQDLQYSWRDSHADKFEPEFQQMQNVQNQLMQTVESHLQEIDRANSSIGQIKEDLQYLADRAASTFRQKLNDSSQQPNIKYTGASSKQPEQTSIDELTNLYQNLSKTFISSAKNGLTSSLLVFVLCNALYNTEVLRVLEAAHFPGIVETIKQSNSCEQVKYELHRKFEVNSGASELEKDTYEFLIDLAVDIIQEQSRKRREEEMRIS